MVTQAPIGMPEAYLLLEEAGQVWRVHLTHARMCLGRAPDCDVVIRDARVAAQHALLYCNGSAFSISRAAAAPVYVDGVAILGSQPLRNGDVIDLAGIELTFVQLGVRSDTLLQLGIRTEGSTHWFALLDRPVVRVGHTAGDLTVPDGRLANPHFVLENFGAGHSFVTPQAPEHALQLNGRPVTHRVRLRDGDQLRAGATHFAVRFFPRRALPGFDTPLLPPVEAPPPGLNVPAPAPAAVPAGAAPSPGPTPSPGPAPTPVAAAAPASTPIIVAAPPAGRRRLTEAEHEQETTLVPMVVAPPEVHARVRGDAAPRARHAPRPEPRPTARRDPEVLVETDRIPRVTGAKPAGDQAGGKRADGHTLVIPRDEALEKLRRERAAASAADAETRNATDHETVTRRDVPTVPGKPRGRE